MYESVPRRASKNWNWSGSEWGKWTAGSIADERNHVPKIFRRTLTDSGVARTWIFCLRRGTAKQQLAFIRELLDADGICQTFVKFGTYQTFGSISDFPAPGNELSFVCISTARHRKVKFAINLRSTYAHVCRWCAGVWLRPNCPSMVQFSVTGPTKEQWFEIRLLWLKNWGISYK